MAERLSWATRLERAEKRGRFFDTEKDLADRWTTCAIGERNDWTWAHRTHEETNLGVQFRDAIVTDNIAEAKLIYQEIVALP